MWQLCIRSDSDLLGEQNAFNSESTAWCEMIVRETRIELGSLMAARTGCDSAPLASATVLGGP
jgi:hypothetical protein